MKKHGLMIYVPDVVKNINVKVFNLMSQVHEIRFIFFYQSCM